MSTTFAESPHFAIQWRGVAAIVHLHDKMLSDPYDIAEVCGELLEFVQTERPPYVIVNFCAVTRCSTAMIGGLLRIREFVDQHGGEVHLCGLRPELRDGYRILRLDGTLFRIHDSVPGALAATVGETESVDTPN